MDPGQIGTAFTFACAWTLVGVLRESRLWQLEDAVRLCVERASRRDTPNIKFCSAAAPRVLVFFSPRKWALAPSHVPCSESRGPRCKGAGRFVA